MMDAAPMEIEAKFIVAGLDAFRDRLNQLSALRAQPSQREVNLRFDLPDGALRAAGRVLRVRQGPGASLTLKAPGPDPEHRLEIEIGIDDARQARRLLEALGYRVVFVYEKDREVYNLDGVHVMLDSLPFGTFLEIESENIDDVRRAAERLGLRWEDRVALTYLGLFEALRSRRGWTAHDATFDAFHALEAPPLDELLAAANSS